MLYNQSFSCFIDFEKSFDTVDFRPLFTKLIDAGMSGTIVVLLYYFRFGTVIKRGVLNGKISDLFFHPQILSHL